MPKKTAGQRIAQVFRKPWKTLTNRRYREFRRAYNHFRNDGIPTKRYEFNNLDSDSIVLDLGGFRGEWADDIHARYGSTIHVFEPHPEFASTLQTKYTDHPHIHVHAVALSSSDGDLILSDTGDASSAIRAGEKSITGRRVEAGAYLQSISVDHANLMKVNIEGGEYDILPHLAKLGWLNRIETIQVQFHDLCVTSDEERESIRRELAQSHGEDWCYPFVWEQWSQSANVIQMPKRVA
ncbi:FkbM family methyltransferase [Rhodopirellula europaea]|jgi:FkbM family methyltransferase|uniref:Methyltransferase, FkbM family protein n=1 Tax=Rhodopirellula europaea SH398 TaxID=1263868 RepID=M5S9F9_9BACT|nr:FkbM family methyltransferase [Rhodopirellula europaea]EMI28135.1 methyltransferase, FkbM family protein [Rhodopirellula europaea SH398]